MFEGLDKVNDVWSFLAYLIIMFVSFGVPFLLKHKADNKKRKQLNDVISETDKKQNERMELIEKNVSIILEFTKDERFLKTIQTEIYGIAENIIDVKQLKNEELKQVFYRSIDTFKNWLNYILCHDFKLTAEQLKNNAYSLLRNVRDKTSQNKLQLSNPTLFLETIENSVIKPQMERFLIDFNTYKNKKNGERREAFKNGALKLVEGIIEDTINYYNQYTATLKVV